MRPLPRLLWPFGLVLLPVLLAALPGRADPEDAAIRETIEQYFRGDIDRDVDRLRAAFHPTAILQTSGEDGRLSVLRQPEWHESVRRTPDRERPDARILEIDRTGNAAMAKTQLVFSHGQFTDYLSLLKLEGGWVIVNKIYQWEAE